ncbi:hypothetical protein JB92DRAFT_1158515 [Gautieria morchelliformis]|nr:hypothetical protein JB92DRAFT_1158515 [Gautieria morchelliformis]
MHLRGSEVAPQHVHQRREGARTAPTWDATPLPILYPTTHVHTCRRVLHTSRSGRLVPASRVDIPIPHTCSSKEVCYWISHATPVHPASSISSPKFSNLHRPSNAPHPVSAAVPHRTAALKSPETPAKLVKESKLYTPIHSRVVQYHSSRKWLLPFPSSVSLYDPARPLSFQAPPSPCASTNKPKPTTIHSTSPKPPTTATTCPCGSLSKHSATL